MNDSTDSVGHQWRADGSGSRHVQAIVTMAAVRVTAAFRAFLDHVQGCGDCRMDGLDCEEATALRQAWRDAKDGAS